MGAIQKAIDTTAAGFNKLTLDEKYSLANKILKDPKSYALLGYASKSGPWCGWGLNSKQTDAVHVKMQELAKEGLFYEESDHEITITPKGKAVLKHIASDYKSCYEASGNLMFAIFGLYDRMLR